jgi:hypothetical protein
MDGKINVLIRGKPELTKKRLQVDNLLKRAMRGNSQAKSKLYKEFGIKFYSPDEVQSYVKKKLASDVVNESPVRTRSKPKSRILTKRKVKLAAK